MAGEMPILYSFRRCPYAMRARMAIAVSGQTCALREIVLRNKPPEMIQASPKSTVPLLVLTDDPDNPDDRVIEESLEIMHWALGRNDPEGWLAPLSDDRKDIDALIAENDGPFKEHLDRYKYPTRYENADPLHHRAQGTAFLEKLEARLLKAAFLCGNEFTLADAAISPFIRQFANNDREWFDALDMPGVQRWLKCVLESDCFLRVMEKYPAWEGGMDALAFPPA
jgi:glutathione S-transferase